MKALYRLFAAILLTCFFSADGVAAAKPDSSGRLAFHARKREKTDTERSQVVTEEIDWQASETAVVVCDMWRLHWCKNATRRAAEFAPRANELVCALRRKGVLIIHCPSPPPGDKDPYKDWPQRKRAQQAPPVAVVDPPWEPPPGWKNTFGAGWRATNILREGPMPLDVSDDGCDCTPQCKNWAGKMDTRQSEAIPITAEDVIAGDNMEAFFVMKQRGIQNVVILGVHLNLCMMGRPYGIRTMVYQGQNVVLVRDLTDALYNPRMPPRVSHHRGTELTVEHIEKYWCPSITSDQILGGRPFRFRDHAFEDTWQATMSACCERLPNRKARQIASGFEPFASDVIRGGDPARRVRLRIRGVEQLSLISDGTPEHPAAHCDWADAKLIAEDGTVTYLSDLQPVLVDQPYGTMQRDKSHRGGPLQIGSKTFERGLGTHAYSEIRFALDGKYEWFEAWVGIDAVAGGNGAGRFTVTDESPALLLQATEQLWKLIARDFSDPASGRQIAWEREDHLWDRYQDGRGTPDAKTNLQWTRKDHLWDGAADPNAMARRLVKACYRVPELQQQANKLAAQPVDQATLNKLRSLYYRSRAFENAYAVLKKCRPVALRLAITDLIETFGSKYPGGRQYLAQLDALEESL